MKLKLGLASKL